MKIPVIGDIHGRWNKVNSIVNRMVDDEQTVLSTGDLGNYKFCPSKGQRLIFTPGNHEHYGFIKQLLRDRNSVSHLYPIVIGETYALPNNLNILGVSGVFSSHFFNNGQSRERTPLKYWRKEDFDMMLSLDEHIDIILSHEAPSCIDLQKNGISLGSDKITALVDKFRPKFLFSGHHHIYFEKEYDGTVIYGLENPKKSFLMLDGDTMLVRRICSVETPNGHRYGWES